MTRLQLDVQQLRNSNTSLRQAMNSLQAAKQKILQLEQRSFLYQGGMSTLIKQIYNEAANSHTRLQLIDSFVQTSSSLYENMEQTIQRNARSLFPLQVKTAIQSAASEWSHKAGSSPSHWKRYTKKFSKSGYNSFTLDRGIKSLIQEGATISGKAGFALAGMQYENNPGNWRNRANLSVGNAEVSGSFRAALKKEGVFDPNITVKVGVEASAAKGVVSSRYVHTYGEISGSASGEVGVASAKAKAVISKKEVTIEGEVGAAAVRGEAVGKFSLFGVTITGSVSGEVGSIGASGKFSKSTNSVEFGGHLSFLFGAGFNFKIDY